MQIINILFIHPVFTPQLENVKIKNKIYEKIGNRKPIIFYNRIPNPLINGEEELYPFIRGMAASHAESLFSSKDHVFVNPFGMMLILDREGLKEYLSTLDNIQQFHFDFLKLDYQSFLECYTNEGEDNDSNEIMDQESWDETNQEIEEFVKELNELTTEVGEEQRLH